MKYEYFTDPCPHIYISELVPREIYDKIKFPEIKPIKNRRATKGIFRGDEFYSEHISSEGWKEFYQYFTSFETIKEIVNIFVNDIQRYNCRLQPDKIYFKDYVESFKEVLSNKIDDESDPNAIFTRFDFQAGDKTYPHKIHCDHPRRLVGGVLFFCDYREEKLEGGRLALYKDEEFGDDRVCHKPKLIKEILPIHNTGVIFLNCNVGFHGNTKITRLEGLRKWIYYSISSKRNIWEAKPMTVYARATHVRTKLRRTFKKIL